MPKCKCCKDKFEPKYFLQKFCMEKDECIKAFTTYSKSVTVKKERKEFGEMKKSLLTHKDYLKLLETVFNTYIRTRDKDMPCISCDKPAGQYTLTAGHFWTAGNYSFLRFNEDNVNGQCWWNCNKNRHGNVGEYRIRLIKRIGINRVKYLDDNREKEMKLSIPEIQELIKEYRYKLNQLKKPL